MSRVLKATTVPPVLVRTGSRALLVNTEPVMGWQPRMSARLALKGCIVVSMVEQRRRATVEMGIIAQKAARTIQEKLTTPLKPFVQLDSIALIVVLSQRALLELGVRSDQPR